MTLTVHTDIEQGSDQWHDVRRGIITASVVGRLITPKTIRPAENPESRGLTMALAAERITGWTEPTYINDDMLRGIYDEPLARDKYSEHYAPVTEVGFMTEDKFGFTLGYSPDGLVGDTGLIEVKSRRAKGHIATILAGHPPIENMAQLQAGLLVTGREWIDYISYSGGLPMYVKRVYPQQNWFATIIEAVAAFEANVKEIIALYQDAVTDLHPTERSTIHDAELKLA